MHEAMKIIAKVYLRDTINKCLKTNKTNIEHSRDYLSISNDLIPSEFASIHCSTFLLGITSYVDDIIRTLLNEIFICYPEKLGKTSFTASDIIEYDDINLYDILGDMAKKRINEILYKNVSEQLKYLEKEVLESELRPELVDNIIEIKATRNLIAHGEKKYTKAYDIQTGGKNRNRIGEDISVSYDYLNECVSSVECFISEIETKVKKAYLIDKKDVLRELWEKSRLGKIMNYETAWDYHNEKIPRPSEAMRNFTWSHSETQVKELFLCIYGGVRNSDLDIKYYFERWPTHTFEGEMLLCWLQRQFYF